MQYYKHTTTGQVYGASERTRPPTSFFESRPREFARTSAPKPARKTGRNRGAEAPEPEPEPEPAAEGVDQDDGTDASGGDA